MIMISLMVLWKLDKIYKNKNNKKTFRYELTKLKLTDFSIYFL